MTSLLDALERIIADVDGRKHREGRLDLVAARDDVTGLTNRAGLTLQLADLLAPGDEACGLTLVFLEVEGLGARGLGDLGGMGDVARSAAGAGLGDIDEGGIDEGGIDEGGGNEPVLIEVAARLRASMRPQDVVARVGVAQFVVVCRDPDGSIAEASSRLVRRLHRALAAPVVLPFGDRSVAAVIEVSHAVPGDEPEAVLARAGAAAYARQARPLPPVPGPAPPLPVPGGPLFLVPGAPLAPIPSTPLDAVSGRPWGLVPGAPSLPVPGAPLALVTDAAPGRPPPLRHGGSQPRLAELVDTAVAEDRLTELYQPVVDLHTGRILGAEALLRMYDRTGQIIEPDAFIPLAEASGAIHGMGNWVLLAGCRQVAAWKARLRPGAEFAIGINLSPRQLDDPDLVGRVEAALMDSGLDPTALVLELTERLLTTGTAHVRAQLEGLRALGVHLAADDFGTGYCSLRYLVDLPLDIIKIDRSWTSRLGEDTASGRLADGVARLATSTGLVTIVEGVETEQERAAALGHGMGLAQGYLFAEPLSAEAFSARLFAG